MCSTTADSRNGYEHVTTQFAVWRSRWGILRLRLEMLTRVARGVKPHFSNVMTYSEQLKSPKWQKRRLQVLEAAGWKCCNCHKEDRQLQVHHGAYLRGVDLWDYPPEMFHVLCDKCHKKVSGHIETFMRWFGTLKPVEVYLMAQTMPKFHGEFQYSGGSRIYEIMEMMHHPSGDFDQDLVEDVISRADKTIRLGYWQIGYKHGCEQAEFSAKCEKEGALPQSPSPKTQIQIQTHILETGVTNNVTSVLPRT